jgi:phytoene dehydrogenase-like protein
LLRQALAIQREMQPARHWSLVRVLTTLGSVLADLGRAEEANVLLAEAVDIARERLAERHPRRVDAERAFRALDTRRSASSRNR